MRPDYASMNSPCVSAHHRSLAWSGREVPFLWPCYAAPLSLAKFAPALAGRQTAERLPPAGVRDPDTLDLRCRYRAAALGQAAARALCGRHEMRSPLSDNAASRRPHSRRLFVVIGDRAADEVGHHSPPALGPLRFLEELEAQILAERAVGVEQCLHAAHRPAAR
jgi:hypothetical protein